MLEYDLYLWMDNEYVYFYNIYILKYDICLWTILIAKQPQ